MNVGTVSGPLVQPHLGLFPDSRPVCRQPRGWAPLRPQLHGPVPPMPCLPSPVTAQRGAESAQLGQKDLGTMGLPSW